jgi:hypothetical protein
MDLINIINAAVVIIGLPTLVGCAVYIGKQLHLLESLSLTTEKIKVNVKVVGDYLTKHHSKFDPRELQAYSPVRLTDVGSALIEEIGFKEVFEENKSDFFDFIDGEHPHLKYDVELASIKSIYALIEKPYMNFLKVYLYNHPNRNMENIAPTLGIYIRDQYLLEHSEIAE